MIRKTIALLVVLGVTSSVMAEAIPYTGTLTNKYITLNADGSTTETAGPVNPQEAQGTWYSSIPAGGFVAFPAATGVVGVDDYQAAVPAGDNSIALSEFRFVGGVGTIGGEATFDFFDAAGLNFVDSFTVPLSQAGNFIWTITVNGVLVDADGIVQMSIDAVTDPIGGQFFLHVDAPTIGTNDINTFGNPGAHIHNFELTGNSVVPEPTSIVLIAMALLGFVRRR